MILLKKCEQTVNKITSTVHMGKKLFIISALITAIITLCACSKQESIDPYEFCKRYNENFKERQIDYQSFFKEDKNDNCYYSFFDINGKTALVTIEVDKKMTVTGISATITGDESSYTKEELQAFYSSYLRLSAELMSISAEEAEKIINDNGIFSENIRFCDNDYYSENDNYRFTLLENKYVITAYTEKTDGKTA